MTYQERLDFIRMMFQNRYLSVNDKKRLVLLATKELDGVDSTDLYCDRDDQKQEDSRGMNARCALTSKGVKYINPSVLQTFLFRYNQNPILKYTCHDIDSDEVIEDICRGCKTQQYDYSAHVELIKGEFNKLNLGLKEEGLYQESKMYSLFKAYIFGGKPWSTKDIEISWDSLKMKEWADSHPGKIPSPGPNIKVKQGDSGFRLPQSFISNISGDRILYFRELVQYLKSLFHIRSDNSLKSLIEYCNEKKLSNYIISFKEGLFLDNIELFTNVEKLIQAYEKIIKDCSSYCTEKPEFMLSFFEEDGCPIFEIHHTNTVYKKTVSASLSRIGQFQSELIEKQLNGLCDLYIEADFSNNEYARINLWDDKEVKAERIEPMNGVKYILKFPK